MKHAIKHIQDEFDGPIGNVEQQCTLPGHQQPSCFMDHRHGETTTGQLGHRRVGQRSLSDCKD